MVASKKYGKDDLELARSALFEAVEEEGSNNRTDRHDDDGDDVDGSLHSPSPFLRLFVSSNTSRSIKPSLTMREQKLLLWSAIEGFGKPQARRFFSSLSAVVNAVVADEAYVPASMYRQDGEEEEDDAALDEDDIVPDAASSENLQFLHYAALAVRAYVDGQIESAKEKKTSSRPHIVEEAFDVASALHGVLFSLNSCGPDGAEPQQTIVTLCERFWLSGCDNRERLIPQVLPLITYAAMEAQPHEAGTSGAGSMKRLFQMRKAFDQIDFDDASSDSLKKMLLRLVSSPVCLKQNEGKRFLAYLLQVDVTLACGLHQAIRAQIPMAKKPMLEAYGEIYFRAWKEAASERPDMRHTIETDVLSDLMFAAIHCSKPATVKSVMAVLEPFHIAKKSNEVAGLLCRSYGPILWRSLSAATPHVRVNAAQVLAQVFPLQDPSLATTTTEQAVTKACTALNNLLLDRNPSVRVAGSEALCEILGTFWDVLPAHEIRTLLNRKFFYCILLLPAPLCCRSLKLSP